MTAWGGSAAVVRRGAAASRRASVSLGLVLLLVCAAAIGGSVWVSTQIAAASSSFKVADLFQDARYNAASEDAELSTYRLNGSLNDLATYQRATADLTQTLARISALGPREAADTSQLQALQAQAEALGQHVVDLLAAGRTVDAGTFQLLRLDPLLDQIDGTLSTLEEKRHLDAARQLRNVSDGATLLKIGTPVTLALTLLLLGAFSLMSRAHRRTIERQALHDALTDLPNRLLFADRTAHAIAAAHRTHAEPVVMMLDLDRFKEVNDTLGHHQGDLLLIEVAARLTHVVRAVDTVARLGGDEFAILLVDGGHTAGTDVAARIMKRLEPPFHLDGVTVSIEASIGIAICSSAVLDPGLDDDDPAAQLLRHADMAMYEAKRHHAGFAHFSATTEHSQPASLALLGELREALEHNQLELYYQPKIAADTGDLLGVEALVRWNHPTRGLLPPAEFIDLAESTTLIQRLTTVVIDKALAFTRSWLDQGQQLPVAVNVSTRSLLNTGFPRAVAAQLTAAGVPAALLCLEITESTIMADPDKALEVLTELRDMGVRLSVDDFGTGYSSMAYLKILPIHELKVDRSFVAHMTTDHNDTVLVESAIDLGHNLGLSVVAEGVEDHATLLALKDLGADIIQGYYLGRPMPGDTLRQWTTQRRINVTPSHAIRP